MPLTPADIIVEDGSIVAGANSYVSYADADAYFQRRPWSDGWFNAPTEDQQCQTIIYSALTLDAEIIWHGSETSWDQQRMKWPRIWVPNKDTTLGYYPAVTAPPNVIIGNTGGLIWPAYLPANHMPYKYLVPAQLEVALQMFGSYASTAMTGNLPYVEPATRSIKLGQGAVELGMDAPPVVAVGSAAFITASVLSHVAWLGVPRNGAGGGIRKLRRSM